MKIQKIKCPECDKVIGGISEKEVTAWLEQHRYYAHLKPKEAETNGNHSPQ